MNVIAKPAEYEDHIPIKRALELCGNPVSAKTILKACEDGRLPYSCSFGVNLIRVSDLRNLIAQGVVHNSRQGRHYRKQVRAALASSSGANGANSPAPSGPVRSIVEDSP